MKQQHVPHGYSNIITTNVLGPLVQFTVKSGVEGHVVDVDARDAGVGVRVRECNFHAIVEFPNALFKVGLYDPTKWHVGFVQNMMAGSGINYVYARPNELPVTVATVGPNVVPCKDAGGNSTWYDPNVGLSLKRFGSRDEAGVLMLPGDFPNPHPARTDIRTRYVEMGDAPGSGAAPVRLPCRQADPLNRAHVGTDYTLGWTDPLDTNPDLSQRAPLSRITGVLRFKTWLAMSSEGNIGNIRNTQQFCYLYTWDWEVTYNTTFNLRVGATTGRASLVSQGTCSLRGETVILTGDDANESAAIKFM